MKNKYVFVAVMLLVLMIASIGLTNFYVQQEIDGGGSLYDGHTHDDGAGHSHGTISGSSGTPGGDGTVSGSGTPGGDGTISGSSGTPGGDGTISGSNGTPGSDGSGGDGTGSDSFYVLTSFYPMYIAAENIVGECDGVILQNLSEPQTGCMHDYQLTTADMRRLSQADVFIVNGGGIENFLADVAKQYPDLAVINASENVELLGNNAHAWMSIPDHMIQVQTITDALAALDKAHAALYRKNGADYLAKLEKLRLRQQKIAQNCEMQNILIFHEAFDYVAEDLGLHVSGGMDLDEERQVSAGEVAQILRQIREHKVRIILAEELYGRRMCETVQKEADVQVIYLDTCVRGDYNADSYLDAMQENLDVMQGNLDAMQGNLDAMQGNPDAMQGNLEIKQEDAIKEIQM